MGEGRSGSNDETFVNPNEKGGNNSIDENTESPPLSNDLSKLKQILRDNVNKTKDEYTPYPNTSGLILSALMALVEDENSLVRRNGLDFIISHFDINHDRLSKED